MTRFEGFDQEKRGPWKNGNYDGVIVPQYETTGSFAAVHKTEDKPTKDGDSRNLKLCVTLVKGNETKNINYTINYRPQALAPERIAEVREMRVKFRGQQSWPDKTGQRDNLGLTKLHELEKAEITLEENSHGGFDVSKLMGTAAKFYISTHRMKSKDSRESEPVPKNLLNDPSLSDEDREGWFNKIISVSKSE